MSIEDNFLSVNHDLNVEFNEGTNPQMYTNQFEIIDLENNEVDSIFLLTPTPPCNCIELNFVKDIQYTYDATEDDDLFFIDGELTYMSAELVIDPINSKYFLEIVIDRELITEEDAKLYTIDIFVRD